MLLAVDVDAATALRRATARAARGDAVSDADADATAKLRAAFAPPTDAEGLPIAMVDGRREGAPLLDAALAALLRAVAAP